MGISLELIFLRTDCLEVTPRTQKSNSKQVVDGLWYVMSTYVQRFYWVKVIESLATFLFVHTEVVCGDPGSGSNVTKEGDNYLYGGIVTFTCVPQHVLTGGGLEKLWIRCTSQGTWNGSAPSCERMCNVSSFVIIFTASIDNNFETLWYCKT